MEMKPPSGPKKQTQFKPNSKPIKPCPELAEALSAAEGAVEWANLETTSGPRSESRAVFMFSDWMVELCSQSIVTGHKVIVGYVFFIFCLLGFSPYLSFSSSNFLRYSFSRRVASRSKTWYLIHTRR